MLTEAQRKSLRVWNRANEHAWHQGHQYVMEMEGSWDYESQDVFPFTVVNRHNRAVLVSCRVTPTGIEEWKLLPEGGYDWVLVWKC